MVQKVSLMTPTISVPGGFLRQSDSDPQNQPSLLELRRLVGLNVVAEVIVFHQAQAFFRVILMWVLRALYSNEPLCVSARTSFH